MNNKCLKCGTCCKAIILNENLDEIKNIASAAKLTNNRQCAEFILENWVSITKDEALLINPYLKDWIEYRTDCELNFYTCKKFNHQTNLCEVHKNRPSVCSGFPFYDKPPYKTHWYSNNCGFRNKDNSINWLD